MNIGRKLRAVIVGLSCLSLLAQTTPSIAAPPVKVKPVTATSKPVFAKFGKAQVGDLSGTQLQPDAAGPIKNGSGRSPNLQTGTGTSGKATINPNKAVPPTAIDVALAADGVITGRVLDSKQNGVANAPVVIRQGPQEVARTFTDAQGRFEIPKMKGGVYLLSSNNGYGLFRFWTKPTAPPAARDEVLLVSQAVVVRAQNADCNDSGEVLYDENGQPYAQIHVVDNGQICDESCPPVGSGGLCCLDCTSLLILGLSAAALTVGILILIDDDDPNPASP